jgi:sugar transferase (PEP-CTERM/EpsH1 system associated)
MNILFVTGNLPFPPADGWKIRVFSFIRTLARRHKVSVVSFMRTTEEALAVERLREAAGAEVDVIPRSPGYSPLRLIKGLVGPTAFPIINYRDERMARLMREVLSRRAFDIVQAESVHMAQYCLGLPHRTILDLHNIESLLMKRYARQERHPLKRAYAEITWRKLATYEREICRMFGHCVTCSEEERRLLHVRSGVEHVSIVPNGVDLEAIEMDEWPLCNGDDSDGGSRLVFVGRMDYHANVDGVRWFCREVLPRVRAHRPDVVFQIVGAYPAPAVARLADPGRVEVTGFVADVRPYLKKATAVVVPLRIGGGTRLKILEGLAMGKPVLSTGVGAEGIAAVPGRDLLIADHPHEFAEQIFRLLDDADLRRHLGSSGRRLAVARYNWDTVVESLEEVYERCLGVTQPSMEYPQPVA